METERTQEYLEAIYKRQGKESPVATSSLAADLKVSQPAVTDMLRTLESRGLIDYKANKGAALTESGKKAATSVIRRHRLWERFLTDILGMKWDKVHEEACRLEHATSPDIEKGLSNILGDVNTCPHGHSIPDQSGNMVPEKMTPLSRFQPSEAVRIIAVDKEDPRELRAVGKLGLQPGSVITVLAKHKDGSVEVEMNKDRIRLDRETAEILMAEPASVTASDPEEAEIPLSKMAAGSSGVIRSYSGGRGMLGRCLSLGFTPGSELRMLENYGHGPVLVKLHDTEVALGREVAGKILVTNKGRAC